MESCCTCRDAELRNICDGNYFPELCEWTIVSDHAETEKIYVVIMCSAVGVWLSINRKGSMDSSSVCTSTALPHGAWPSHTHTHTCSACMCFPSLHECAFLFSMWSHKLKYWCKESTQEHRCLCVSVYSICLCLCCMLLPVCACHWMCIFLNYHFPSLITFPVILILSRIIPTTEMTVYISKYPPEWAGHWSSVCWTAKFDIFLIILPDYIDNLSV